MNETVARLSTLNAEYARTIDDDRLEAWPDYFVEDCLYSITTADNHARGMQAGLVWCDTRDMLHDRVAALRKANVYERQRYRHIIGQSAVLSQADGEVRSETPFLVVRIMRDGTMDLFATGRYLDEVADVSGKPRFRRRIVVCDGSRVDTLLAIPL
jgi:3-phenylpropionate/cinnamic acid dioxygenase small subunit